LNGEVDIVMQQLQISPTETLHHHQPQQQQPYQQQYQQQQRVRVKKRFTSKIKHATKLKTSSARLAQLCTTVAALISILF